MGWDGLRVVAGEGTLDREVRAGLPEQVASDASKILMKRGSHCGNPGKYIPGRGNKCKGPVARYAPLV